jgi:adenine/guanine/hypoxanthine permease
MNEYLWGKIVPGVGLSLLIGNLFYSWQAIRMTVKYKRQYTAQPYGLNTPGAFAFVFNIIYNIFYSEGGGDQAFIKGYNVALAANVVTGLISIVLGCFGRLILKVVPPAALLVPIASLGFAFLGLNQLTECLAAPIVGYNAIIWVYLGWYAQIRMGYGWFRVPEACQVILVGAILGWATGLNTGAAVSDAASLVKWYGPGEQTCLGFVNNVMFLVQWQLRFSEDRNCFHFMSFFSSAWSVPDLAENFGDVVNYLGLVIPLGISAAATSLMCLVSAKEAGDPFPVRESLIADGIGTVLSSFLGSPFGTVIYVSAIPSLFR